MSSNNLVSEETEKWIIIIFGKQNAEQKMTSLSSLDNKMVMRLSSINHHLINRVVTRLSPDYDQWISNADQAGMLMKMMIWWYDDFDDHLEMMMITCEWNGTQEAGRRRKKWSPTLLILIIKIDKDQIFLLVGICILAIIQITNTNWQRYKYQLAN